MLIRFLTPTYNDHPEFPGSGERLLEAFPLEADADDFRQLCRSRGLNWPNALDTLALYGCKSIEGAHDLLIGETSNDHV